MDAFDPVDVGNIQRAFPNVQVFASEQETPKAGLAIPLLVNQSAQARKHGLIAKETDVRRISLARVLEICGRFKTIGGFRHQRRDLRRRLIIFEEVGAIQALLQGVDDGHRRSVSLFVLVLCQISSDGGFGHALVPRLRWTAALFDWIGWASH